MEKLMKDPSVLTHEQLVSIIVRIQQILYFDPQGGTIAPDKQWNGADVCQDIAGILDDYGLVPTGFNPAESGR